MRKNGQVRETRRGGRTRDILTTAYRRRAPLLRARRLYSTRCGADVLASGQYSMDRAIC